MKRVINAVAGVVTKFRINPKHISAVFVIFAMLSPIAVPVPTWAYGLNLPPMPKEPEVIHDGTNLFDGVLDKITGLASAASFFAAPRIGRRSKKKSPASSAATKSVVRFDTELTTDTTARVGEPLSLSAIPMDKKGNVVDGVYRRWTSSDPSIIKIANDAEAVPQKPGEVVLTLSAGAARQEFRIRVTDKSPIPNKILKSAGGSLAPAPLMLQPTENVFVDGILNPQNNLGSPAGQVEAESKNEAAALRTRERAGSSNYSFNLPIASLPGRGIDASVGLTYNSRLWSKIPESTGNKYYFNVDRSWAVASGFTTGYGHLDTYVVSGTNSSNYVYRFALVSADGTRTELSLKTTAGGYRTYESTDGTFIQMRIQSNAEASSWDLELNYPDGTLVRYGVRHPDYFHGHPAQGRRFPNFIRERNGNYLTITYRSGDTYGRISTINDTLGRQIIYEYNSNENLVAITVPGYNGSSTRRQAIRFYYSTVTFTSSTNRFSDGTTPIVNDSFLALQYVYYPGTASGYKFEYSSAWGVVYEIKSLRGMQVSTTALDQTGYVTSDGTTAATTTYNYPTSLSDTSQPAPLNDVPKFTTRTDDWLGRTTSSSPVTQFSVVKNTTDGRTETRITAPDDTITESWSKISSDWQNGLVTDNFVKTEGGLNDPIWSHQKLTWQNQSGSPGRQNPRVITVEDTNQANQTRATTFEYDSYNNQTVVREFDYGVAVTPGNEARKTETTYVTSSSYVNRNFYHLPLTVKTWTGSTLVARTEYQYDGTAPLDYNQTTIINFHGPYNPNNPPDCNWECPFSCQDAEFPGICNCDEEEVCVPTYDMSTAIRGNVTKVTSWADPTNNNDPDKSVKDFGYDITGNVVSATMSCCNIKTIEYDDEFHYAYPTKETKGASPTQLILETDYDFNTGLRESTEDENDQVTDYEYDSATWRATEVIFPNGAWSQFVYNDSTFPYHVKTTTSIDSSRSVSRWGFYNGIGQAFRSRRQSADGYVSNDVEYDEMGRAFKSFNPYTVSNLADARPSGIKSTEATLVDPLGRVLTTRFQDDTTTSVAFNDESNTPTSPTLFNRSFVTITDQAGKKRRQLFDGLGRLVRVDEPIVDTSPLGPVDSPHQPTVYEYDGNDNVTRLTQVAGTTTQERLFKYDAMSRLTHERQVEADATLDNSGVKQTSGGLWTGVYTYTSNGLIESGTDSRGVKTEFSYDSLNRLASVVYTGETGYQTATVTYAYDQAEGSYKNLGRLTRIQTASNTTYGTPATEQNYDYDAVGQIKKHVQTFNGQTYELEYGYNLAGQLISQTYPSGKTITMTVDNFGLPQTIADSQRTYLTGLANNSQGLPSQATFGNGTTESFVFNDRLQSTSQSLHRGATLLQKYEYSYGEVTVTNGNVDSSKNNGQLGKVESWIGSSKQWSQRFAYDEVGRLSEAREHRGDNDSLTYKQRFDFDRFGNLYRKSANNPTTGQANPLPYTPIEDSDIEKEKNRIANDTTYDAAGNVVQDDLFRGLAVVYDANHRVAKVTPSGMPDAHSVYDGLGNRVATKINGVWEYMIYDAFGKLVAEYGVAKVGGTGVKYFQQDWRGSTRTVTNSNGYVIGRTDYQAFGETISTGVGLRTTDTGHSAVQTARQEYALTESDKASGQQHTWFRKLETRAGRWTSPDPYNALASRKGDPQALNKYGYVRGEPTNFVDPTGLMMQVCGFNDNGDVICVGTGGGGGYGGSNPGGSSWYGSGWYGSAANSYDVARALAGGFFGEGAPRGRLTRVDRMRNNTEDEWSLFGNYYFTPDFGGYTGIDRSCAEGLDPGVASINESSGDCAYSSYKACEAAQKNICHAEGEERFWHVMSTGGFTATGVGAAVGTVFAPGLGTAIGGVIGGAAGTYAAARAGEATEKRCKLQIPEKCVACKGS